MRIYFARHGETEWNARRKVQGSTDTPLNEVGIAQAHRLAEKLAGLHIPIGHVYSSEMQRAHTTAQIVADRLGVPCETRPGLQELNLGDWEGYSWRQIEQNWPEAYRLWEERKSVERPPNGECYAELLERFVAAVLRIVREAQTDVLIVSHSACLLSFQATLNRTPIERMLKDYAAPNAGVIAIESEKILARWPEV